VLQAAAAHYRAVADYLDERDEREAHCATVGSARLVGAVSWFYRCLPCFGWM